MVDKRTGFTLMELMIVVAIIGLLAAIAMPAFQKYLKRTKSTEARLILRKIYDGQIAYYDIDHIDRFGARASSQFVSVGPTPVTVPGVQKVIADWTAAGWSELKVSSDAPVLYRYTSISSGVGSDAQFTARAEGDIDGDGTSSLFERIASIDSSTGEVTGGSGLFVSNELE